jgi:hypothetical protein
MRQRKIVMKELRFLPSQRALFISKLSWASQIKGPNTSTGFFILPREEDKAAIVYQRQETCVVIRRKLQYG